MTAREWREKADAAAETFSVDLPLPSGMVIRARRPGPLRFAQWQRVPMMIGQVATGGAGALSDEEALEIIGFMRELVAWCCVEPRIDVDGGDDAMHPRDVPDRDFFCIVNWAMRTAEAQELRPFRGGRRDAAGDGGGENVFLPPVDADGDRGPGAGPDVRPGGDQAGAGD
jgi:hypothetical protein